MNVFSNLINLYNLLPFNSTYRTALRSILVNLRKMEHCTIYETAEISAASRTTIWRMVKLMGYKTFSDFNHALSKAISQYSYHNRVDMGTATPDISKCIEKISVKVQKGLSTLQDLNMDYTMNIIEAIHAARRVGFYGFDGNAYITALQQNLSMNGKETSFFMLFPDMLEDAATTDKDTITFVRALEFVESMDLEPVFIALKKQGGKIILLHTGPESRYSKYADLCLNQMYNTTDGTSDVITVVISMAIINEIYRGLYNL